MTHEDLAQCNGNFNFYWQYYYITLVLMSITPRSTHSDLKNVKQTLIQVF